MMGDGMGWGCALVLMIPARQRLFVIPVTGAEEREERERVQVESG